MPVGDGQRKPVGEDAEGPAAATPIPAGIDDDTVRLRRKPSFAPKIADLFDQRAADFLGDVSDIGAGARQLPREAVNAILETLEECGYA